MVTRGTFAPWMAEYSSFFVYLDILMLCFISCLLIPIVMLTFSLLSHRYILRIGSGDATNINAGT